MQEQCRIFRSFKPRTKKDRDNRLKFLLMGAVLCPPSAPIQVELAPSTWMLVRSALAPLREAGCRSLFPAPRRDSAPVTQDSQHHHVSLMEIKSTLATDSWHHSLSLVPKKKQKKVDRGCSPTPSSTSNRDAVRVRPVPGHSEAPMAHATPSTLAL